jgi:hypothetical protein
MRNLGLISFLLDSYSLNWQLCCHRINFLGDANYTPKNRQAMLPRIPKIIIE